MAGSHDHAVRARISPWPPVALQRVDDPLFRRRRRGPRLIDVWVEGSGIRRIRGTRA